MFLSLQKKILPPLFLGLGVVFNAHIAIRFANLFDAHKILTQEITKSQEKNHRLKEELELLQQQTSLSQSCSIAHESLARLSFGLKKESENYMPLQDPGYEA